MRLRILQILVLGLLIVFWYLMTAPGLIPPVYFDKPNRAAFFFGEPQKVFWVIVDWFATGEIFRHLGITLLETALGFVIGAAFGLGIGLWLANQLIQAMGGSIAVDSVPGQGTCFTVRLPRSGDACGLAPADGAA